MPIYKPLGIYFRLFSNIIVDCSAVLDEMEAAHDQCKEGYGKVQGGVPLRIILKDIDIHAVYALAEVSS